MPSWLTQPGLSLLAVLGVAATGLVLLRYLRRPKPPAVPDHEAHARRRALELEAANQALCREIAERERAESQVRDLNEQLRRRVAELQSLLDALPVGVGIAEDSACQRIRMNAALAQLLRLPHGANASLTAPGDRPANFRVLRDGQPLAASELPMQISAREGRAIIGFEETIEHADGTRHEVVVNAVPVFDIAGRPGGCVATLHDVSEFKRAIAANARLASIIAHSADAIVGKTLTGIVTDWNLGAQAVFGYTAEEMVGRPITCLFPPDRLDEEDVILARVARGETVAQFETVRVRKDGTLIDVSVQISPIRDARGRVIGASKSARDITSRKRAERLREEMDAKIQETQKLESLGVLAGGIAHDFNNLLTGILGFASLGAGMMPPTSPVQPMLQQIDLSARRAADLCRQMLAYAGRGQFVVQPINLNQLISETTHLIQISINKSCVLRLNLAPELPGIMADATQMRQVVMNLVINASEAVGGSSGVIALTTGVARIDRDYLLTLRLSTDITPGDYVFLEVSDNGCGMDAATVARIFEPFFTTKFTGRGLGLAAVLGIVRSHSGGLKVYSEPGRGTTFKVFFPCLDAPAPVLPLEPGLDDTWRGGGEVLVVDDEETVRSVAARILETQGFQVTLASDGRAAMELFRAAPHRFALVLLDLTMPHLDGEETYRQMRHLRPGVRVVMMSGFNEHEVVGRFAGHALAGFVQKPFEAGTLIAAAREALRAG